MDTTPSVKKCRFVLPTYVSSCVASRQSCLLFQLFLYPVDDVQSRVHRKEPVNRRKGLLTTTPKKKKRLYFGNMDPRQELYSQFLFVRIVRCSFLLKWTRGQFLFPLSGMVFFFLQHPSVIKTVMRLSPSQCHNKYFIGCVRKLLVDVRSVPEDLLREIEKSQSTSTSLKFKIGLLYRNRVKENII